MRNSLTHGWFYISQNNFLEMYDNRERKRHDYSFYWHASIPIIELLNVINQEYYNYIYVETNKNK
jgi:hypothetical protein